MGVEFNNLKANILTFYLEKSFAYTVGFKYHLLILKVLI